MCHFSKMHQSWVWSAQHTKCRVGGWILQVLSPCIIHHPLASLTSETALASLSSPATSVWCSTATGSSRTGSKGRTREELPAEVDQNVLARGGGWGGFTVDWIIIRQWTNKLMQEGRNLFKRKGDKLCARDKKPKQSATQPEGVWFCVRFHWKLSSASQEYEVARKMKWNGLLSFFRQPEKIKFSWILCNQMRCICETCFYLVD